MPNYIVNIGQHTWGETGEGLICSFWGLGCCGFEDCVFPSSGVRPFTCSSSPTAKNEFRPSWAMFTSPLYIKFSIASTSSYFMPFRYRSGWECGFLLRTDLKKGLQAERITLWASTCLPSQANVTSKKSLSSLSSLKAVLTLLLNSFHLRQKFSELPAPDILDFASCQGLATLIPCVLTLVVKFMAPHQNSEFWWAIQLSSYPAVQLSRFCRTEAVTGWLGLASALHGCEFKTNN